jgi:hypothetical protein
MTISKRPLIANMLLLSLTVSLTGCNPSTSSSFTTNPLVTSDAQSSQVALTSDTYKWVRTIDPEYGNTDEFQLFVSKSRNNVFSFTFIPYDYERTETTALVLTYQGHVAIGQGTHIYTSPVRLSSEGVVPETDENTHYINGTVTIQVEEDVESIRVSFVGTREDSGKIYRFSAKP